MNKNERNDYDGSLSPSPSPTPQPNSNNEDNHDKQRQGMENAARGMSTDDLVAKYKQLTQGGENSVGSEIARDVVKKELLDRGVPLP